MALPLPASFSALIFDCDGTLVDTAPAHFHALQEAFALQGHSMSREWYMARTGLTPHALLTEHEERLQGETQEGVAARPLDRAAYYGVYDQLYRASLEHLREVEIVAELAREWSGRIPLGVASNGHLANVRASLDATGLLALFQTIVSADDVPSGKPAPDVFLEAARRLGVPAELCVVLEDSNEGLTAARAAGMAAVDVRPFLPSA